MSILWFAPGPTFAVTMTNEFGCAAFQMHFGGGYLAAWSENFIAWTGLRSPGRGSEPPEALIENPNIPKMGVNILNDGKKLFSDFGIIAKNLVELGAVALVADPSRSKKSKRKIVSLATLTQRYCGKILEKGSERTSNWEHSLSQQQLDYAANDVHSALMIYRRLQALAEENAVALNNTSLFTTNVDPSPTPLVSPPEVQMQSQFLRAYRAWHDHGMSLDKMCVHLSVQVSALKRASVMCVQFFFYRSRTLTHAWF
ncbi:hypothetical protein DXG03_000981 [Asterophora parasitica]|uniref:3'-5' exonuclease domain-containing protein n=1 Tax=Asterophora parasitica TaxID=117018 RepID=A0A9P7G4I5_9AGAR|nr:hypothetical protein DXG03_000981 [Asterophora parasitica]